MDTLEKDTLKKAKTEEPYIKDLELGKTYVFWNVNMETNPVLSMQVWTGMVIQDLGVKNTTRRPGDHHQTLVKIAHDQYGKCDTVLVRHPHNCDKVIIDKSTHPGFSERCRYRIV